MSMKKLIIGLVGLFCVGQVFATNMVSTTAGFDCRDYYLEVFSNHGSPVPSVGTHSDYCWQSSVTCSVESVVSENGTIYTFTNWSGTGSVPSYGNTNNTGTIVLSSLNSSIVWNWIDPDLSLPFTETFDSLNLGALATQHGWTGTGTVQNATTQSGEKALSLSESSAAHSFDGAATNIWITLWAQPVPGIEPTTIDSGASAVFYVSTNNLLVAYDSTNAMEIAEATVSNGWNKIEVFCDYVSNVWNLELNETLVVSNYAFYGAPTSFQALEISENTTNTLFVDSIGVTDRTDSTDADGDGMADSWETTHFGSTDVLPGAMASNGVNTVLQAYIAGLDPTCATNRFQISDLSSLTSESVLRWNSVSGRVYSVYWSSNLLSGFVLLSNNLHWAGNVFTDETHNAESKGFYKVEVEME